MNIDFIKKLAEKKGHSAISSLEATLNLGNGTIGKWKTAYPKADTLYKLAQYLGVSMEELIEGNLKNKKAPSELSEEERELFDIFNEYPELQGEILRYARYLRDSAFPKSTEKISG